MRAAIELFGSQWCPPCGKAKEIITASSPDSKGVKFRYIDVGEDPGYAMKQLPVIFVGDEILEGPTEGKLRAALDRLYAAVAPPPEPTKPEEPMKPDESKPPGLDEGAQATQQQKPWLILAVFAALGFVATQTLRLD